MIQDKIVLSSSWVFIFLHSKHTYWVNLPNIEKTMLQLLKRRTLRIRDNPYASQRNAGSYVASEMLSGSNPCCCKESLPSALARGS